MEDLSLLQVSIRPGCVGVQLSSVRVTALEDGWSMAKISPLRDPQLYVDSGYQPASGGVRSATPSGPGRGVRSV